MQRLTRPGHLFGSIIAAAASLLIASAPASAHADRGRDRLDRGEHNRVVRAALPPGAVRHIFVIELENESASTTFGPARRRRSRTERCSSRAS